MKFLRSFWFRLVLVVTVDVMVVSVTSFLYIAHLRLPRIPETLENLNPQSGVNIFASDGTLLYSLNRSRTFVPLTSMSEHLVDAVLATEDAEFYKHRGFSLKSLAGAFADNIATGRKTRGGSTITQQIVKNIFLTREKSYLRKVKELLIAVQLEEMFERKYGEHYKDRLLELYINGSFYGTNAYGIEDAAQVYFDRPASDLTLLQSAVLAGLPNAPSAYRPVYGDSAAIATARRRAEHVLNRMVIERRISPQARESALVDSLHLNPEKRQQNRSPYLVETIKEEVSRRWGGSALSFGALDIYTTLDLTTQHAAQKAIDQGVTDLDQRLGFAPYSAVTLTQQKDYVQAALLCVDYRTGHVKAMVGGRDIFASYYNRATSARRQPGSGFKPIVYLSAFESGQITPLTRFIDEPRTYVVNRQEWSPKNFQDSYLGETTVAWALIRSANATSVQIVQQIGPARVIDTAQRLGIDSPLLPVPSIALGSNEITMMDLVTAYGTIANSGLRVDPTFVTRIVDRNTGQTLYRHSPNPIPAVDPINAYTITRLMENVVNRGTGYAVRRAGFSGTAAGKTGTTNDNTDAWFTGFTPELVTSVWIGFDSRASGNRLREPKSRRQITGGSGAAPIWAAFMKSAAQPSTIPFYSPPGTHEVTINPLTGVAPTEDDTSTILPLRVTIPDGIAHAQFIQATRNDSIQSRR
jgi:1A family penicillin-binding protein